MKNRKTIFIILTAVIIANAAVTLCGRRPVTQEELRDATVDVYREDCYLRVSGNDTLLAFSKLQEHFLAVLPIQENRTIIL